MSKGRQIVLTADRSLMSNYRQNMLYGFTAVMPAEKLSKFLYYHVFCPKVGANPATGETQYAPLGLRRIESSLMDEFGKDNVIIGHSEHIEKCIGEGTEVVGINAMDPLGNGPITTSICGDEYKSYASLMFSDLMGRSPVFPGSGAPDIICVSYVIVRETDWVRILTSILYKAETLKGATLTDEILLGTLIKSKKRWNSRKNYKAYGPISRYE